MSKKLKICVLIVSLVLAFIYNWMFPSANWGLNCLLFVGLFLGVLVFLKLYNKEDSKNMWSFLLLIPILWFAVSISLYSSDFVKIVAPLAMLFLLFLFLFWSGVGKVPFQKIKRLFPIAIILFFGRFFSKMGTPFSGILKSNHQTLKKVILAIFIVIPLSLMFIGLFAGADLIFKEGLRNLFDFDVDSTAVWHVFRTIFWFFFFGGILTAYISKKRFSNPEKAFEDSKEDDSESDQIVPGVVLGILNLIFLSFIFIQLMFLFGGHEIIAKYNITYANYVHQGFYQMAFITVLVLLISYVIYRVDKNKKLTVSKYLTSFLILQTLVIVASALKRMFLYQEAYGLTQLRFLVEHFIIYLGIILVVLFVVILMKKHYRLFIKTTFVLSIMYLMFMTAFNMQGYIAKVNIDRYFAGQDVSLDVYYLGKLSTDTYAQMQRLKSVNDEYIQIGVGNWKHKNVNKFLQKINFQEQTLENDLLYWVNKDEKTNALSLILTKEDVHPVHPKAKEYINESFDIVQLRKYWKTLTKSEYLFWLNEIK